MTIGAKIKELRKKNDLTQEKLADFLGVSYQAVSKWETGLSSPDISLIAPLTRLFKVSADELFGLVPEESDPRKEYFDEEYREFTLKDDEHADYEIAKQAVSEYPGEFKYLYWLAVTQEQAALVQADDDNGYDFWRSELEASNKYLQMIVENCEDTELKNRALWTLALRYAQDLKSPDEAIKYAQLLSKSSVFNRDHALTVCFKNTEKHLPHAQKMLISALYNLCICIEGIAPSITHGSDLYRTIFETEEKVIRAVITDENFLEFSSRMQNIYRFRARFAVEDGDYDGAVSCIKKAIGYQEKYEHCRNTKNEYTSPLLNCYVLDNSQARKYIFKDYFIKEIAEDENLAPLRERDDFKALISE